MTVAVNAKLNGNAVEQFLKLVPKAMDSAAVKSVLLLATEATGVLAEEVRSRLTKRPTGALARSFKARLVSKSAGEISAEAVSRLPYAAQQDQGGTIRPRKARALAIPHPMARIPRGKGPRDYPGLFMIKRDGKSPILALAKTRGPGRGREGPGVLSAIKPMFTLHKSVTQRGVGYVAAAEARMRPRITEVCGVELGREVGIAAVKAGGHA